MIRIVLLLSATSIVACSTNSQSHGLDQQTSPPATSKKVAVQISSFKLAEDCPESRSSAAADLAKATSDALFDRTTCDQSQMILSISGPRAQVSITSVTVSSIDGKVQSVFQTRQPRIWRVDKAAYVPWDQLFSADVTNQQVSYKISAPKWDGPTPWGKELMATVVLKVGRDTITATHPVVLMVDPHVLT